MREDIAVVSVLDEALAAFPKDKAGNAACRQFATDLLLTGKAYSPLGEIVELFHPAEEGPLLEDRPRPEKENYPEVEPPLPLVACRTCKHWAGDRTSMDTWGLCCVDELVKASRPGFYCFRREPFLEDLPTNPRPYQPEAK
jgi:hypothetical protein